MTNAISPLHDFAFMRAFLDLVIPASSDGRMPSAGSLGLADGLADRLQADAGIGAPVRVGLQADAGLSAPVRAGLQAVREAALERDPGGLSALSPEAQIEVLESRLGAHPALMIGLAVHLYPAYYSHPSVLEGLGEPPRPPFPEGYEVAATDERLLEILRARSRAQGSGRQAGS